ncbi:hypothetical protein IE4803_PB00436 (plasmid) [Rhizobium etli bv. phaseoli str. IE4803]|nr:hypothetical protein IE4803_PB00436 [Rhizobium etli bv. phaseoli str. IE4803]
MRPFVCTSLLSPPVRRYPHVSSAPPLMRTRPEASDEDSRDDKNNPDEHDVLVHFCAWP